MLSLIRELEEVAPMLRTARPTFAGIIVPLLPALVVGLGTSTALAEEPDEPRDPDTPTGYLACPPEGPPLAIYDGEPRASEAIFANYDGAQLSSGQDNAPNNTTQLSACSGNLAAYGQGSKRTASFQNLASHYEPFDVIVSDTRPGTSTFSMAMATTTNCYGSLGVSPLDCGDQNPNNISFCFIGANDNMSAAVHGACLAHELGHAFGLDHVNDSGDIMNPTIYDGSMTFKDQCISTTGGGCGSHPGCGGGQQNGYAELMALFGPSSPDVAPPTVEITYPNDGDTFDAGADFTITVEANDDKGVVSIDLYNNGTNQSTDNASPWSWDVQDIPEGSYSFHVIAFDQAGNEATSNTVNIGVGEAPAPDPGDDGGSDTGDDGGDGGGDGDTGGGDDGGDGGDDGGGDGGDGGGDGGGEPFEPEDGDGSLPPGYGDVGVDRDLGCGCGTSPRTGGLWLLLLLGLPLARRRS
jgi:MYXO-CTERM domain-containing protein